MMPSCCTCLLNRRRALSIDSPSKIRIAANADLQLSLKMGLLEGLYATEIHSVRSFQLDQCITRGQLTHQSSLTIYEPTVGKFSVKSNGGFVELQFVESYRYPGAIVDPPDIMVSIGRRGCLQLHSRAGHLRQVLGLIPVFTLELYLDRFHAFPCTVAEPAAYQ